MRRENMTKMLVNGHQSPKYTYLEEIGVAKSKGGCYSVEFV